MNEQKKNGTGKDIIRSIDEKRDKETETQRGNRHDTRYDAHLHLTSRDHAVEL